ncbi:hypothetical protein P175DRAFT_0435761 [Aspergillus ochraceoroseus IBT 24754]|nr:uncharacterized protein P175DRAFT_0435761 [Aspergillus ochraceoroseus IBT 24754]PTU22057.1 hypothetical protein P175DRAFT_0435761 [Aspergillus ochraceoroseus IBT 24754]
MKLVAAGVGLGLFFTLVALATSLIRALLASRQLVSLSDKGQTVLGKPLVFRMKFSHTRRRPVKDRFDNRFLVVGIPVGLRCRFGNLLAIDDDSLDVSSPPGRGTDFSWNRIVSHFSCWFSFDSARFLHRGDHGVDLREKLDNFLRSQNEDPAQWPYAYVLSVPQFLGWVRNVVVWWYLYNENRELDAVILEINNSYWEKRNVLVRVDRVSDKPTLPAEAPEALQYLDDRQLVQSLPSAPRATFYKGVWHKYIFASPFEKVDGVVSNRFIDPLQPSAWKANAPFSNMVTMEESGEVRMTTRLTCAGPPIDPTQMSAWDVARLVFWWTLPGVLTTPEIVFKALKIRFSGAMKMNSKPPVRSGSVGRNIKKLEIDLEPFFRAYLSSCLDAYPYPVELSYLPCRSFTNDIIRMRSPSYREEDPSTARLSVEPTDPQFYTRLIHYPDAKTAIARETQPTGHVADPTAQRLIVSDPALLTSILESASSQKIQPLFQGGALPPNRRPRQILALFRGKSSLTFMDEFALASSAASARAVYISSALRLLSARALAFRSQTLLGIYIFFAGCLMRWLVLEGLLGWASKASASSLHMDLRWSALMGITAYLVVMRLCTEMKNRLLCWGLGLTQMTN